jgi:hypothetical protein
VLLKLLELGANYCGDFDVSLAPSALFRMPAECGGENAEERPAFGEFMVWCAQSRK